MKLVYPKPSTLNATLTSTLSLILNPNPKLFTLHLVAVSSGHREVATLLLDKGAAMDAKDNHGATPLHLGFRIHNPSTSNHQLVTLKPSTLNSLNPFTHNPHPSPFFFLPSTCTQTPLTLSPNPEPLAFTPRRQTFTYINFSTPNLNPLSCV